MSRRDTSLRGGVSALCAAWRDWTSLCSGMHQEGTNLLVSPGSSNVMDDSGTVTVPEQCVTCKNLTQERQLAQLFFVLYKCRHISKQPANSILLALLCSHPSHVEQFPIQESAVCVCHGAQLAGRKP
jgi:hypothetical protein